MAGYRRTSAIMFRQNRRDKCLSPADFPPWLYEHGWILLVPFPCTNLPYATICSRYDRVELSFLLLFHGGCFLGIIVHVMISDTQCMMCDVTTVSWYETREKCWICNEHKFLGASIFSTWRGICVYVCVRVSSMRAL